MNCFFFFFFFRKNGFRLYRFHILCFVPRRDVPFFSSLSSQQSSRFRLFLSMSSRHQNMKDATTIRRKPSTKERKTIRSTPAPRRTEEEKERILQLQLKYAARDVRRLRRIYQKPKWKRTKYDQQRIWKIRTSHYIREKKLLDETQRDFFGRLLRIPNKLQTDVEKYLIRYALKRYSKQKPAINTENKESPTDLNHPSSSALYSMRDIESSLPEAGERA